MNISQINDAYTTTHEFRDATHVLRLYVSHITGHIITFGETTSQFAGTRLRPVTLERALKCTTLNDVVRVIMRDVKCTERAYRKRNVVALRDLENIHVNN